VEFNVHSQFGTSKMIEFSIIFDGHERSGYCETHREI